MLFLQYNFIPAPYSIYEGIYKLLPGCSLRITSQSIDPSFSPRIEPADNTVLCPKSYWRLGDVISNRNQLPGRGKEEEIINELDILLTNTVRDQLVADVPVGVMLSGGIDSSLITAIMQKIKGRTSHELNKGFNKGFKPLG